MECDFILDFESINIDEIEGQRRVTLNHQPIVGVTYVFRGATGSLLSLVVRSISFSIEEQVFLVFCDYESSDYDEKLPVDNKKHAIIIMLDFGFLDAIPCPYEKFTKLCVEDFTYCKETCTSYEGRANRPCEL